MPEVGFYTLDSHAPQQRLIFACKLIEKVYRSGLACFVLTAGAEQAAEMDHLLWTFRPGSFVPHQIYGGTLPALPLTVLLGAADIPESRQSCIVNLSEQMPELGRAAERILEVIDGSESCKQAGRQRYRQYRQQGLSIAIHKI